VVEPGDAIGTVGTYLARCRARWRCSQSVFNCRAARTDRRGRGRWSLAPVGGSESCSGSCRGRHGAGAVSALCCRGSRASRSQRCCSDRPRQSHSPVWMGLAASADCRPFPVRTETRQGSRDQVAAVARERTEVRCNDSGREPGSRRRSGGIPVASPRSASRDDDGVVRSARAAGGQPQRSSSEIAPICNARSTKRARFSPRGSSSTPNF
jgi:hypothetical protein